MGLTHLVACTLVLLTVAVHILFAGSHDDDLHLQAKGSTSKRSLREVTVSGPQTHVHASDSRKTTPNDHAIQPTNMHILESSTPTSLEDPDATRAAPRVPDIPSARINELPPVMSASKGSIESRQAEARGASVPGCIRRPSSFPQLSYVWNIEAASEDFTACAPSSSTSIPVAPGPPPPSMRWPTPWAPYSVPPGHARCPFPCVLHVGSSTWRMDQHLDECSLFLVVPDTVNTSCAPRSTFALLRTASSQAGLDKFRLSNFNAALYAHRQNYAFYIRIATEAQMEGRDGHYSKVVGLRDLMMTGWHTWVFFADMDSWFTSFDYPLDSYTHPTANLVMQDESRLATAAFLIRVCNWSLALLDEWYQEGFQPYTHKHPFEQTALIHIVNRRMSGLYGYQYHGSCPEWFTTEKRRRNLLSRLSLQVMVDDSFSRKAHFKYNFVCNIPERHALGCLPIPLVNYDWSSVGLAFIADNGTESALQMITCTYTLCSRRPGLVKHTGSAFWKSCETLIPLEL